MTEKKQKLGTLSIYTKNVIQERYEGNFSRDVFSISVFPEEAFEHMKTYIIYKDSGKACEKALYIAGKNQQITINMDIIDTMNFRV